MSIKDGSLWKLVEIVGSEDAQADVALLAITMISEGATYCVAVSADSGLTTNQAMNALRAGLTHFATSQGVTLQMEGARDATKEETEQHKRGLN